MIVILSSKIFFHTEQVNFYLIFFLTNTVNNCRFLENQFNGNQQNLGG